MADLHRTLLNKAHEPVFCKLDNDDHIIPGDIIVYGTFRKKQHTVVIAYVDRIAKGYIVTDQGDEVEPNRCRRVLLPKKRSAQDVVKELRIST